MWVCAVLNRTVRWVKKLEKPFIVSVGTGFEARLGMDMPIGLSKWRRSIYVLD